ncbi:MAG: ArsR family transcriptional regulator [Nanoarchaeota archaeon]|nr:ArsR family transcriptional regulator [Nanoarchaeota archaeon]
MGYKVTIVRVRKNSIDNINQELQWLGNSLGLFNLRDRDSSCFRVFITLVKMGKNQDLLSSDEIATKLNLSRSTVVHHLTKLIDSGIVVREKNGYLLRESHLQDLIKDIHRDINAVFVDLQQIAQDIDEKLG